MRKKRIFHKARIRKLFSFFLKIKPREFIFFFFMLLLYQYIYKVLISVCPIITHESLNQFASNFDWGTRENHGNILSLVLRFKIQ